MSNLAKMQIANGNLAGAEELASRTVEIGGRVLGENHPAVGRYLLPYAAALERQGRLDEARAQFERAAEIYRSTLTTGNYKRALPLLSLSGIHLEQGRPSVAESTAREAHDILKTRAARGNTS